MPMRFPYLKAARVKLQERKNACLRANCESAVQYTAQFLSFAQSDPVVRPLMAELSVIAQQRVGDIDDCIHDRHPYSNSRRRKRPRKNGGDASVFS